MRCRQCSGPGRAWGECLPWGRNALPACITLTSDLRHTAASWMRMSGADIHTVALQLGHKDLRMAARYQHLSPAFLGDAVGKLDGVLEI